MIPVQSGIIAERICGAYKCASVELDWPDAVCSLQSHFWVTAYLVCKRLPELNFATQFAEWALLVKR